MTDAPLEASASVAALAAAAELAATEVAAPAGYPLDVPVRRGERTITHVRIRKPKGGELRGTTVADIVRMDVGCMIRLLPRVTLPALTEHDVAELDPADFAGLSGELAAFFMPARQRAELGL